MLTKKKSKKVWKLKYLALLPMLIGMLFYTSCEQDFYQNDEIHESVQVGDIENLTEDEESKAFTRLIDLSLQPRDWSYAIKDQNSIVTFTKAPEGSGISGPGGVPIKARMHIESKVLDGDLILADLFGYDPSEPMQISIEQGSDVSIGVPFAVVEKAPIFPGCEDAADSRACFQEKIQKHISKNFRYPEEAQKQGVQGRVSVMFTIDEWGHITDIRKRGPHKLLEDETVRIIEKLPRMQPGKSKGKAVRVPFSIPITFKLKQAGFNPYFRDANYVRIQEEQLGEMSDGIQIEYRDAVPFAMVENVPVFPGCEDASDLRSCFQEKIQRHISKNFRYPMEAQERGIQGRVSILFLIDPDGNITNIAKSGPDESLEDEAVRIISLMPKLKPGSQNGKNVAVPFSIPITFKLK